MSSFPQDLRGREHTRMVELKASMLTVNSYEVEGHKL